MPPKTTPSPLWWDAQYHWARRRKEEMLYSRRGVRHRDARRRDMWRHDTWQPDAWRRD
eukprot:gene31901-26513_t